MDMTWLYVLMTVSLCQSLPAISRPSCDVRVCQVSEDSLDSALAVFLCFSQDQLNTVTENEKKLELAEKIAPYLLSQDDFGVQVKEMSNLDTDRLVPLVNLILHDGDNLKTERKTEEDHIDGLIGDLVKRTNLDSNIFLEANLILLSQIDCTTQGGLDSGTVDMDRNERGAFIDSFDNLLSEKEPFVSNLFSTFEAIGDTTDAINSVIGDATGAIDGVIGVIDGTIGGITNAVDVGAKGVATEIEDIIDTIGGAKGATDVIEAIGGAVDSATGGITNAVDGGAKGATEIEDIIDTIGGAKGA